MSTSHFAFSLFIQVQLLPILFLFHILCLCATARIHLVCALHALLARLFNRITRTPGINQNQFTLRKCGGWCFLRPRRVYPRQFSIRRFYSIRYSGRPFRHSSEADITLLDDMEKAAECVLKEDMFSALYSPDKVYIIDGIEPSDSVTSLDITEQYFGRTSLATRTPPSIHYSEEQELDMTQREETLKPSISISKQDIILPRVPDGTPIFSRYTIDDNVIFPIRKPSSQRNSTSFSEDIKSAFKKVATWAKTKDELSVDHSRSSISPRSSVIGNFSLFKVEEADPTVPERDSYDSWPFIRNRIQKDFAQDVLEDEEESIENIIKSALGYNRLA